MKCVAGKTCSKQNAIFEINRQDAIVPTECEIGKIREITGYFQYRAPNLEAPKSQELNGEFQEEPLAQILRRFKENYSFTNSEYFNNELKSKALDGNNLCDGCKRFVCLKKNDGGKESDLDCLLRHIRNAIAHGHVYIFHAGNHISICLEDAEGEKTKARIICNQADLIKAREYLIAAIKKQNEQGK